MPPHCNEEERLKSISDVTLIAHAYWQIVTGSDDNNTIAIYNTARHSNTRSRRRKIKGYCAGELMGETRKALRFCDCLFSARFMLVRRLELWCRRDQVRVSLRLPVQALWFASRQSSWASQSQSYPRRQYLCVELERRR